MAKGSEEQSLKKGKKDQKAEPLSFDAAFKLTAKKFGSNTIMLASSMGKVHRVPIGIPSLDFQLGGGAPMGRIVHIAGDQHSGKTFLSMMISAALQKAYPDKMVLWLDLERSFDTVRAEHIGIDLSRIVVCRPASCEAGLDELIEMAPYLSGGVVDSVAALSSLAEVEATMMDKQIGAVAAMMAKFFHKWISATAPENIQGECPMLVLTNQLRDDIGSFIKRTKTTGGRGMLHYPSVFIELTRGPVVKLPNTTDAEDEEVVIGHDIKFKVKKNNTFQPDKIGSFMLCTRPAVIGKDGGGYTLGVNQVDWPKDLLKYAVHYEVVRKNAAWYEFGDPDHPELKVNGKVEAQAALHNDGELAGKINQLVLKEIRKAHGIKEEVGDTKKVEKPRKAVSEKTGGSQFARKR